MEVFKRIITPERARELHDKLQPADDGKFIYIRKIGDRRVTGYKFKVIFYTRIGGNDWSRPRLNAALTVYYN